MNWVPPCDKCGWKYGGFHVCIIDTRTRQGRKHATEEVRREGGRPPAVIRTVKEPKSRVGIGKGRTFSEDHRENISEGRRESYISRNADRDRKIIATYKLGTFSQQDVADELGLTRDIVGEVLRKAAKENKIQIRPRGTTIKHGG